MADVVSREIATLERAASGLRDATGAERVFCALLGDDGNVRFRAAAPLGAGSPGVMSPSELPGSECALIDGVVCQLDDPAPLFRGTGRTLVVPWTSGGEVLGLAVIVLPWDADTLPFPILALVGSQVGESLAALRDCGGLVRSIGALSDSTHVLDSLIDACPEPVKLLDLDGHIMRWNPAAERKYGWLEPEVLGQRLPHLPEDSHLRVLQDLRGVAAGTKPVHRDTIHLTRDGTSHMVELTLIPVRDIEGDAAGVLSVTRFTDSRDGAFELETRGMSRIAEEITGPMTALVGYAQLLTRSEILDDPARRMRTLRSLERQTATTTELLDTLVLAGRLEGEAVEIDRDSVDCSALIADVVGAYEQSEYSRRVLVDFEPSMPEARMDRSLMSRAVLTVLAFVAEHTIHSDIEIRLSSDGEAANICVNSAHGDLQPSALERVWTESDSGDSSAGAAVKAIEMRLARRIIEAHGGSVHASVGPGAGIMFSIRIPQGDS